MKVRYKLRLVPATARPLANLSRAEKLAQAKAYLQRRGLYVLDRGTPKPKWGVAGEPPRAMLRVNQRGIPTFMERISEGISTLWRGR